MKLVPAHFFVFYAMHTEDKMMNLRYLSLLSAFLIASAGLMLVASTGTTEAARGAAISPISKECSAKADEQKLTGRERRLFRSKCIREAKKAKKATQ